MEQWQVSLIKKLKDRIPSITQNSGSIPSRRVEGSWGGEVSCDGFANIHIVMEDTNSVGPELLKKILHCVRQVQLLGQGEYEALAEAIIFRREYYYLVKTKIGKVCRGYGIDRLINNLLRGMEKYKKNIEADSVAGSKEYGNY